VKNLFGLWEVYLQAFMTRLTPVIRTQFFLKLTFSDKNRLAAFVSFVNKESGFAFWEGNARGCGGDLDSFFVVTN
jgi:hypothetical protein